MTNRRMVTAAFVLATMATAACASGKPDEKGLRDSFAAQMASNKNVTDFQRNGDDLTFTGPGVEPGGVESGIAKWRIHLDAASIEPVDDERAPYKGTVKSSWFANDRPIVQQGRESNLPAKLITTGLAQDCWAIWDPVNKKWNWE